MVSLLLAQGKLNGAAADLSFVFFTVKRANAHLLHVSAPLWIRSAPLLMCVSTQIDFLPSVFSFALSQTALVANSQPSEVQPSVAAARLTRLLIWKPYG